MLNKGEALASVSSFYPWAAGIGYVASRRTAPFLPAAFHQASGLGPNGEKLAYAARAELWKDEDADEGKRAADYPCNRQHFSQRAS